MKPWRKNSVPSVVMNDGMPVAIVMTPLTSPTTPTPRRAQSTMAIGSGHPHSVAEVHEERRHRVDVPERQVDLAGDQQHRPGRSPRTATDEVKRATT